MTYIMTTDNVSCKRCNLIYLATCCKCKIQYVVEIEQILHEQLKRDRVARKEAETTFPTEHYISFIQ